VDQEWLRLFGFFWGVNHFYCVREAPAGGYIAAGFVSPDIIYRLNQYGNTIWQVDLPWSGHAPLWVEPTADGGFVIPTTKYNEDLDGMVYTIYKLNAVGEIIWINEQAGIDESLVGLPECIREDENGFLYTCGTVLVAGSYYDFYVSKRNSDGSVIWAETLSFPGGPYNGYDTAYEMVVLADGNVVACGFGQDAQYDYHRWFIKLSSNGELLWQYEQPDGEAMSIDQGRDGSIITAITPRVDGLEDPESLMLMKFEPEVEIELQAWTPVIPETGGWLRYGAHVSNILIDPTPLDTWIVVTGPNSNRIPLNQFPVTLQPGATYTEPQINVWVPPHAPDGEYTYEVHLGDADDRRNMGFGSFTFEKGVATSVNEAELVDGIGWPNIGDSWNPFTGELLNPIDGSEFADGQQKTNSSVSSIPMISVSPNPFNSSTTVKLTLPDPERVRIRVINALGQVVSNLNNATLLNRPGISGVCFM